MSRTYRRKHAAQLVGRTEGSKIAGVYTQRAGFIHLSGHGHATLWTYREPTKRERYETNKRLHGEKNHAYHRFCCGVPKFGRKFENTAERLINKRLIKRFLKGETETVVEHIARRHPMKWWG